MSTEKYKNKIPVLIFVVFIVFLLLFHFFGFTGYFGYDDLNYAQLAFNAKNGIFDFNNHFTYRFPVVLLTAASYAVFGVSDFSSTIATLCVTGIILFLIHLLLKKEKYITQIIGLSITLFTSWFIYYSDKLMPDIYVALSVILSLFIISKYKFGNSKKNPAVYAILLSTALLFGFTAKETIVLIIPLLAYFIIIDFILKRDIKFWLWFFVSGIILLTIYFLTIWLLTGDAAKRFEAIAGNSYLNLCSYDKQPLKILLERISFGFINMLIYQSMLVGLVFIFVYVFQKNIKSYYQFSNPFSLFLTASILLFLSSNFMTISLNSYSPMCLDPRHFLFLIPVAAIPAAIIFGKIIEGEERVFPFIIVFVPVTIASWFLSGKSFQLHYLPIILLLLLILLFKPEKKYHLYFVLLFAIVMMITPAETVKYAQIIKYRVQKQILIEQVLEKNEDCIVVTDEVQKRLGNYYLLFNPHFKATFLSFDDYNPEISDERKRILFLNSHTRYLSNISDEELPYYARNISSQNNLLYENASPKIFVYEMNDVALNVLTKTALLTTLNDFENSKRFWNHGEESLSIATKHAGKSSNQFDEFSSTFSYPLDSLSISGFQKIIIESHLFCNYNEESKPNLVISIENSGGAYFWRGIEMSKFIKAYSNWWPVNLEIEINSSEIKPASQLKIYVWNPNKKRGFVDDFEIKIFGLSH